jgi:uncharacterized protein (TIGR02246 family)
VSEGERDLIAAIEERLRAAYAAGDADAIAAQYTEDAVLAGADLALTGREVIAETYRGFFATATAELENAIEEIEVMADGWAFVRGRLRVRSTPRDGGETDRRTGKYLAIARRGTDGVWRFARDLFALDSPETT